MDVAVVGMIVGRLLFSCLLVWLVLFLWCKFEFRRSLSCLYSVGGIIAIALVFVLPLLASLGGEI